MRPYARLTGIRIKDGSMAGILYGVGVGPGDPELLTLKAVRAIEECDMIGIPAKEADTCTAYQIALKAVPGMAKKPVLSVAVPMTKDKEKLDNSYEEGSKKLIAELSKGKKIAFLNLGDPTIYSTYMNFHERVVSAGYQAFVVNGVPSFCAVAGVLGISLGAENENIHILPGSYRPDEAGCYDNTRILMKSGQNLKEVKEHLIRLQNEGNAKAYAVTDCGMKSQEVCSDISKLKEQAGYFTTIIVKEEK